MAIVLLGACISRDAQWQDYQNLKPKDESSAPATTTIEPVDKASCEKAGGVWDLYSQNLGTKECNLQTTDEGMNCTDSSQCQGYCLTQLTSEQLVALSEGAITTQGNCTSWTKMIGCHALVEKSKIKQLTCMN